MTEHQTENPSNEETTAGPRWGRIAAWGGLFTLLLITGLGLVRAQEGPVSVDQHTPEFTLTTFDNREFNSTQLEGKVILLNFWASWCIPCVKEADELEGAWQRYKDSGEVIFLGVAWSDMDTKALEYLAEHGITYPNGPDLGTRISQAFRTYGVPETYIINKEGIITHVQIGEFSSIEQIAAHIEAALEP